MKKILYFLKIETRLLKKSIILIALILTVFLSAFMGVLSMRLDFVNGFYSVLDENYSAYSLSAYYMGKRIEDYLNISPNELYKYSLTGLTCADITFFNEDGQSLSMYSLVEDEYKTRDFGTAITLNNKTISKLNSASNAIISGQWNSAENQICIDKAIADALNLAVGDTATIVCYDVYSQYSYVISGILDKQLLTSDYFFGSLYYYYISGSPELVIDSANMIYYDIRSAHACYEKFSKANISLQLAGFGQPKTHFLTSYFTYITPIKLTLDSVTALFLAVMVVILYTLMTLFFRQRKSFICQLKLLGANDGTIFGIYLGIAVAIFLVVTAVSSGLGLLFNSYFMYLCETVFELPFRTTFSVLVPLISFAVLALITALLFAISGRRIRSDVIAQEIKAE